MQFSWVVGAGWLNAHRPCCGGGGCRALHDGGWGLSPEASAKGETRVTSNESRVTKMPRWGILLFLAETKGLFRCASSPCKIVRTHNRRTPVRLFAAVRTLAPGFESTLSNTIKNHAHTGVIIYCGGVEIIYGERHTTKYRD